MHIFQQILVLSARSSEILFQKLIWSSFLVCHRILLLFLFASSKSPPVLIRLIYKHDWEEMVFHGRLVLDLIIMRKEMDLDTSFSFLMYSILIKRNHFIKPSLGWICTNTPITISHMHNYPVLQYSESFYMLLTLL